MYSTKSITRVAIIWIIIPSIHFYLWYIISLNKLSCNDLNIINYQSNYNLINNNITIQLVNAKEFDSIRNERLAEVPYVERKNSIILNHLSNSRCDRYIYQLSGVVAKKFCLAIVYYNNNLNFSYDLIRSDSNIDEYGELKEDPKIAYAIDRNTVNISIDTSIVKENDDENGINNNILVYKMALNKHNENKLRSTGFFRQPPLDSGRERIYEKAQPFFEYFDEINEQLSDKLSLNDIKSGDDLIVMVVNEGEIDLYLNFACSCQQHDISLDNLLVFSGSKEIIDIIESTGAMALYHIGYGSVSKKASMDYLDRTFVDMMWYKAFSVYLILRQGINVLFQDVDLVWFKSPFSYFREYLLSDRDRSDLTSYPIEGFFSDDGQRTHRYTPFFANSGFYYLTSTPRTIYLTWSIMTAFDIVQVTGSHQNVLTMRLMEGLGLNYTQVKLLSLDDFPTGITYHHNKKFMKKFFDHQVSPYNFHMCWTQGKQDKLVNFKKSLMWYVTETCSELTNVIPPKGYIYTTIRQGRDLERDHNNFSMYLLRTCCYRSEGSM